MLTHITKIFDFCFFENEKLLILNHLKFQELHFELKLILKHHINYELILQKVIHFGLKNYEL